MKRKRARKLLMSYGVQRNVANQLLDEKLVYGPHKFYAEGVPIRVKHPVIKVCKQNIECVFYVLVESLYRIMQV